MLDNNNEKSINYLLQSLEIAHIRRGFCAPNPAVGAIVVKDNEILSTGFHYAAGSPHAEVEALTQLGAEKSVGATLYVTLEPCCHWGKTPPCTDLIITQGIKEVYYGFRDPNPMVAGKGEKTLQAAGIACHHLPSTAIDSFYKSYQHWHQTRRPWVTAKLALSLDGKIAGPEGQPVAITGPELQQYTHQRRKQADAILTTAKTIQRDNPQLNVRLEEGEFRKPLYVLDSQLSLSPTARVFSTTERIVVFHQSNAPVDRLHRLAQAGAICIAIAKDAKGLRLDAILDKIGEQGIQDLWIEAGGRCFQAWVTAGLVQQGLIYVAPKWLGSAAQSAFAEDITIFSQAKKIHWEMMGHDSICKLEW